MKQKQVGQALSNKSDELEFEENKQVLKIEQPKNHIEQHRNYTDIFEGRKMVFKKFD